MIVKQSFFNYLLFCFQSIYGLIKDCFSFFFPPIGYSGLLHLRRVGMPILSFFVAYDQAANELISELSLNKYEDTPTLVAGKTLNSIKHSFRVIVLYTTLRNMLKLLY